MRKTAGERPGRGYRRVFEEYSRVIAERFPDIRVEGDNYLPQPLYRYIASFFSVFKLVLIGLVLSGKNLFPMLGVDTPGVWTWSQENKLYACLMIFFVSNMVETQCMSTGAFEVSLNDVPVWSKLQSGRVPSPQEILQILDNHVKLSVGSAGRMQPS
ncbi:unnamed protein product [Lampetra planeri]